MEKSIVQLYYEICYYSVRGKKTHRENPVAIILINDIHNSQYFQSNPNNNKNLYKNGWQKWSFSFVVVVVKFQFVFIVGVARR